MLSKADHIDDLESPVDKTDKMANLSPRAEIGSHEEQRDKKKNRNNHEGRNKEENSEKIKRMTQRKRGL